MSSKRKSASKIQAAWRGYRKRKPYIGYKRYKKDKDKAQDAAIRKLKALVYNNQEKKWIDNVTPTQAITSTGEITQSILNYQGISASGATVGGVVIPSGPTTREGNKIHLNRMEVRFHMVNSSTDIYNRIRVICFLLKDPETSSATIGPPTIGDILEVPNNLLSYYKKNSQKNYQILYDKMHSTGGCTAATVIPSFVGSAVPNFKDFKVIYDWPKGLPIRYKSSPGAMPITNQIWFIFISDSQAGNHPGLSAYSRINFTP